MTRNRTRRWATWIAATSCLLIGITARLAAAQNAEAEILFRDGDRLMTEGKIAEACEAFDGSNRIEARAGTLIRLGDCREKNQQLASAWSAFSDAVARAKDPKKKEISMARVAALEPRLSHLTIDVPPANRVAGITVTRNGTAVDSALWGRPVPVDGGDYKIVVSAPDHDTWSTEVTVPIEKGDTKVDAPPLKERVTTPTPPLLPNGGGGGNDGGGDTVAPSHGSMWTLRRKIAVGVAGGGVVAMIGAVIIGTQAKGLEDEAHTLCPSVVCAQADTANAKLATARSRARLANLGYGVAAGAGVTAGILWLIGGHKAPESGVAIAPVIEPGAVGAVVQGRF